jgi:uncharacterized cupin superfamily protein
LAEVIGDEIPTRISIPFKSDDSRILSGVWEASPGLSRWEFLDRGEVIHVLAQRGGVPSAFDRVLATRLGMAAIDSVVEGFWGTMVALKGTEIEHVSFEEALGKLKAVPQKRYAEAAFLFG